MKASWRDKTWNKSTVPKPINKMWEKQNKIYNEKDRMKKKTLRVILASCWLRCWWQSDVNKHTTGNMEVGKNDRGCAHRSTFPMEVKDKEEWCEWWPDYDIDLARNNPRCVCVCSAWAHSSTKAAWTLWSLHIPAHRDLTKISDASSMNEASYFEFYEHQRLHYCIVMARICVFGREKYVLMGNILLSLCYFGLQLRLSVLSIDL